MDHKVLKNNILSNNVSPFHQECRLDAETRDTRSKIKEKENIIMNQNKSNVKHISNSSCVCASPNKSQNRTNGGIKF